jgi:hypothetical protein
VHRGRRGSLEAAYLDDSRVHLPLDPPPDLWRNRRPAQLGRERIDRPLVGMAADVATREIPAGDARTADKLRPAGDVAVWCRGCH